MSTYEAVLRKWCFDRAHLCIARCRNAIGQLNYFARDVDPCESVCKVDVLIQIKSRANAVLVWYAAMNQSRLESFPRACLA